ncbi:MAG: hypothetical protein AAF250_12850 [Pseudomonadota bacterium]
MLPTTYKGVRFRSRAEARWAVAFDKLRLDWDYEPEGFELAHGWYLPDFYIPYWDAYFEVKGRKPNSSEILLADDLSVFTWKPVIVTHGPPHPDRSIFEGHFSTFCPEIDLEDERFADWHVGGFVYGRREHHPECSFHMGNLMFLGCPDGTDLMKAISSAASHRFGSS